MPRIPITDEIHAELIRFKNASGLAAMRLLARCGPVPDGLDSAIINTWLNRKTQTARADHLDFVLNAYRKAVPVIAITEAMRADLTAEFDRTGYAPKALLNRLGPPPEGLSPALISRWKKGQTLSARQDLWDFVFNGLKAIPAAQ